VALVTKSPINLGAYSPRRSVALGSLLSSDCPVNSVGVDAGIEVADICLECVPRSLGKAHALEAVIASREAQGAEISTSSLVWTACRNRATSCKRPQLSPVLSAQVD
jgi:hypothetical protein